MIFRALRQDLDIRQEVFLGAILHSTTQMLQSRSVSPRDAQILLIPFTQSKMKMERHLPLEWLKEANQQRCQMLQKLRELQEQEACRPLILMELPPQQKVLVFSPMLKEEKIRWSLLEWTLLRSRELKLAHFLKDQRQLEWLTHWKVTIKSQDTQSSKILVIHTVLQRERIRWRNLSQHSKKLDSKQWESQMENRKPRE